MKVPQKMCAPDVSRLVRVLSSRASSAYFIYLFFILTAAVGRAQSGASVYPAGVDTILSGLQPSPGKTMIYDYTSFYYANETVGPDGLNSGTEFKLRVFADAIKVVHNWNVPFLGGTLHSNLIVPILDTVLHVSGGRENKAGIGNISAALLGSSYHRKTVHWYYEGDVFFPAPSYLMTDTLNEGQHNFAAGPAGAITYLPFEGKTEFSSKFQFLINSTNDQSHYRSGNEFTWEYDAMQTVNTHLSFGVSGALFKQVTDDKSNGISAAGGGSRSRNVLIGPQLGFHVGRVGGAFKYQRDTLVLNHPRGNTVWFQCAFLLNRHVDQRQYPVD